MADYRIHAAQGKGALPMFINRSFISAYFLTVQTYKRMRLITQVCGNYFRILRHIADLSFFHTLVHACTLCNIL